MKHPTILILGGYGAVGRRLARLLLEQTSVDLVIAGRRLQEAEKCSAMLQIEFPDRAISARYADATDQKSLSEAFTGIDLVAVLTTTPEHIRSIAEAALECGCNYLDILVSASVWQDLSGLAAAIQAKGRTFISQAGFHPGLLAVLTRYGARFFDRYDEAVIAMAMNATFERPEQAAEMIPIITDFTSEIFEHGAWRKAKYSDAITVDFGPPFGRKELYPFWMEEMRAMPTLLGLQKTGVYISGFNWMVDYVIMPLIIAVDWIAGKRSWKFLERIFFWGANRFAPKTQGVVVLNDAAGIKNQQARRVRIRIEHEDAYHFTVVPIVACLKQFLDQKLAPGLHMMGHVADVDRLIGDMTEMGCKFKVEENA